MRRGGRGRLRPPERGQSPGRRWGRWQTGKVAAAEEDFQGFGVLVLAYSMGDKEARARGPLPGFWHVQNRGPGGPRLTESAGSRRGLDHSQLPGGALSPPFQLPLQTELRDRLWTRS